MGGRRLWSQRHRRLTRVLVRTRALSLLTLQLCNHRGHHLLRASTSTGVFELTPIMRNFEEQWKPLQKKKEDDDLNTLISKERLIIKCVKHLKIIFTGVSV